MLLALKKYARNAKTHQAIDCLETSYPTVLGFFALILLAGFLSFILFSILKSGDKEPNATVAAAFAAAFAGVIGIMLQIKDRQFHEKIERDRIRKVAHMIYVELTGNIKSLELAFCNHQTQTPPNQINMQLEIYKKFLPLINVRARIAFIRDLAEMTSESIALVTNSTHRSEEFNSTMKDLPELAMNRPTAIRKELVDELYKSTRNACDALCSEFGFDQFSYTWKSSP